MRKSVDLPSIRVTFVRDPIYSSGGSLSPSRLEGKATHEFRKPKSRVEWIPSNSPFNGTLAQILPLPL